MDNHFKSVDTSLRIIMVVLLYFAICKFMESFVAVDDTEASCLSKVTSHQRVRECLDLHRPAGECLQEAYAYCLRDLALKGR
jgi:hypothetical protein